MARSVVEVPRELSAGQSVLEGVRSLENMDLDRWLGRNLRRATNAVFYNFSLHFGIYKIRPALFAVLIFIEKFPGSSGARLSEMLDIPRANMVLLLRELEQRGLIERESDPQNRRAHLVTLTERGEALMPDLHAAHAKHTVDVEAMLSTAEYKFVIDILQRIWKQSEGASSGLD